MISVCISVTWNWPGRRSTRQAGVKHAVAYFSAPPRKIIVEVLGSKIAAWPYRRQKEEAQFSDAPTKGTLGILCGKEIVCEFYRFVDKNSYILTSELGSFLWIINWPKRVHTQWEKRK